jgi:hypothetical protein
VCQKKDAGEKRKVKRERRVAERIKITSNHQTNLCTFSKRGERVRWRDREKRARTSGNETFPLYSSF